MICHQLSTLLGFECHPINNDGTLALLHTPFRFADGDPVPVFIQAVGQGVRFFDDGLATLHFSGRGLPLHTQQQCRFLTNAAQASGTTYTQDGILEAFATSADAAAQAFASYMRTIHALCAWEREHEGSHTDAAMLVEEVAMAYRARHPQADIRPAPTFTGISGKTVVLDLQVDNTAIAITSAHHSAISAALHKVVDISQSTENSHVQLRFVIDDRTDPARAKAEANILQAAAPVQLLSHLEQTAAPGRH